MPNQDRLVDHQAAAGERPLADTLLNALSMLWSSGSQAQETAAQPEPVDEEARYRALVDQIPAVVFMAYLDRAATRAYVSPHIETALGFSQDEWLDDPVRWYDRIHPEDKQRWSIEAAETLVSGKPLRSVYRVIAHDERVIWLQCEVKTVRRETGEPWFIHGVAFDISEIKDAETKLREAHEGLERRIRERTATLEIEVERRKRGETALAEKLGQLQCLYETASAAGRAPAIDDVFEVALRGLRTALQADRAAVLLFDPDGVIRFKAWAGLSAQYRRAVEGHSPWNRDSQNAEPIVVSDVEKDPSVSSYLPVLSNEGIRALAFIPLLGEARLIGKLMAYFDTPHEFTENEIRVAQTVASHISFAIEKKLSEEQRAELLAREKAAREEAEQASHLKDQFLAMASHELRTPLAAILGWTHLLESGGLDEADRRKAVQVIDRNAKAQARIVDEILDVSRITSGRVRLNLQEVNLAAVIEATTEAVRPTAEAKGIQLQARCEGEPGILQGDPDKLQQAVCNLLANAIKFTSPGGRVSVVLRTAGGRAELLVSDTGEGIHPDFIPHVFEPFRQADPSASRKHGGLGLGLAIVRQLVELHGGTVRAASPGPGQGTTFTAILPVLPPRERPDNGVAEARQNDRAAQANSAAESTLALPGLRVLLVEDEADARESLALTLAAFGAQVQVASSAQEALDAVETLRPNLLLSDIGLPGEDGWSLIRKIRAREARLQDGNTPAIALTGYASGADRERALRAGYNAYLAKPVDAAKLVAVIAEVVGPGKP